jgi:hypothetical protein
VAKESGLAWTTCSVDDHLGAAKAIVNDVLSLDFTTPRELQETTGLDVSAVERELLLADMSVTLNGVFNPAAGLSHDVFKSLASTSVARTTTLTISAQTLACECLYTDYALNRAADGSFTWSAPGQLQDGTVPVWS